MYQSKINQIKFTAVSILIILSFNFLYAQSVDNSRPLPQIEYKIDLTNHKDDLFHVTVLTENLTADNIIYNFAATAPGTYEILNFGRFVQSFTAFDFIGNELKTEQISVNQWKIVQSSKLSKIIYTIEDSYDTEIKKYYILPMSGTGIQDDFIVLNTFGVLGYFDGFQSSPVRIKIMYKSDWMIGTALEIDSNGYYFAESYDRLADSPVLLGDLTKANLKVNDIDVEIFLYTSDTSLISVDTIQVYVENVLQSAGKFINYSPVPYYKFLLVLLDNKTFDELISQPYAGALEHSYSSLFVWPGTVEDFPEIKSDMAHEFMHILTPLNLHSEVIHTYNFVLPTASEHIWLYEGVTEWASEILQLRDNLISLDEYLNLLSLKLKENDKYDPSISLSQMSLKVYDDIVKDQFGNFYERGAVIAALLDIKLLELSDGKKGLREVYLELLKTYGKNNPFPEKEFFDIIVRRTYPEIEQFINNYIKGSDPLPCKEYFAKLGIDYFKEKTSDDKRPMFGFGISTRDRKYYFISNAGKEAKQIGLQNDDEIIKLLGKKVSFKSISKIIDKRNSMNYGDFFDIVIKRNEEKIELSGVLLQRKKFHVFEIIEKPSVEQKFLREKWIKNF